MLVPQTQRIVIASANIRPARILALSTTTKETAAEATGVTAPVLGVSVDAYKFPYGSYEQQALPYTALTGDAIPFRGPGMTAICLAGAAISNLGRPLVSDANGQAISLTPAAPGATVNWVVGFPIDTTAASGERFRIWVTPTTVTLS